MDLMLSLMDEGFHLGSAVAALMVITHSIYMGLESVDEVTHVIQKCLLLHFHVVRLRPGSGVLLEIAVWVLDMAFHLWFLLVDCTRVLSSLYFKNRPMQILHCVLLFIFHLQILRRYCMGIHVTVENIANPAEDANEEVIIAEPPPVAVPAMMPGRVVGGVRGGDRESEESSMQGSQTLQESSASTSKLTSTVNEPSFATPKVATAVPWESCSCPRSASRDELSIDLGRHTDYSEGSVPMCRCNQQGADKPPDALFMPPSKSNVSFPGLSAMKGISKQDTSKLLANSAVAEEPTLKSASSLANVDTKQAEACRPGGLCPLPIEVVLASTEDVAGALRLLSSEGDVPGAEEALHVPREANEHGLKVSLESHSLSYPEPPKPIVDHSEMGEILLSQEHLEPNVCVTRDTSTRQPVAPPSQENVAASVEGGSISLSLVPSDTWSVLEGAADRRSSQFAAPSVMEAITYQKIPEESVPSLEKPGEVKPDD
ncbi:unnamed protein product, partial [Ixodes hexagonus]